MTTNEEELFENPIQGIPILPPKNTPSSNDKLIGYRIVYAPKGIFCKPKPKKIGYFGWINIALLAILFWPVSCLPCCMSCSYSDYQIPIYTVYTDNEDRYKY